MENIFLSMLRTTGKFTVPTTPEQNAHVAKKDYSWIQSQENVHSSMLLRNNQRASII